LLQVKVKYFSFTSLQAKSKQKLLLHSNTLLLLRYCTTLHIALLSEEGEDNSIGNMCRKFCEVWTYCFFCDMQQTDRDRQ